MCDCPIPAKYVLYSHYAAYEQDDSAAFTSESPIDPEHLKAVRHLSDHFRGLKELLTSPGHQGLLVLFYAPGYEDFLNGLALGKTDETLRQESPSLRLAEAVGQSVKGKLAQSGLADCVRFVTSFDLRPILGRVNAILASQFREFFLGPARGIRYDTSKVVEAILRLRLLGNGIPVLRVDHDVIFRGGNRGHGDLGLFKAAACALRAYQLRVAETAVSTFLFSASYNYRALLYPTEEVDRFEAWSRAFATRVYPALLADPTRICEIVSLKTEYQEAEWNDYVKAHLNDALVRQFYGLRNDPVRLEVDGTAGLTSIGAHPLYSVISGALLCLSEGAILDLPPFSNFRMNVMWIDDHLKYSLHRSMNHFTSGETLDLEAGLSDARLDDVMVTKARPFVRNLPIYIFDVYLPTLLWGAIVDAWITSDPILKCRAASLAPEEQDRWRAARADQENAPLPSAMLETLRIGSFDGSAAQELRVHLGYSAVKRIEEVRQLWARLKNANGMTFASFWAQGVVKDVFGDTMFKGCDDMLWQGIAPGRPLDLPIENIEQLPGALVLRVTNLIEDTVAYVRWTLEWPKFVQIVRSIRQGDFIGDLGWQPSSGR